MPTPSQPSRARLVAQHLGIMTAVAVALGVLTAGLAMPFAAVTASVATDVAETMENLPADLETQPLAQKTSVVDAKGNLIASFYDENRVTVTLDQISKPMKQAILSIEDYRFYEHGALDLKGTMRALLSNQASDGVVQGGSTITQQMVKLTLVDQAKDDPEARAAAVDDTYARKLRELSFAIAFEQKYSKDWILERYLNIAYFGDGAYGVQAAARRYFNKNAKKLTVKEAAMLAGLVKNPVGYDPGNFPDRALSRRNVVLDRMAQLNVIPQAKADKLKAKGLGLDIQPAANGCVNSPAPFFCDYVYRYLLEDKALGKTKDQRSDLLRSGGLTIKTTIDLDYQKAADASVSNRVYPKDQAIGALAMVEPRTGDVKALAQSRPMGTKKKAGQTYLNYLVPKRLGDSNGFQAGSTFKPFVLAAALNQGKISMTQKISSPVQMSLPYSKFETCEGEPYGTGVWTVNNATTSGLKDMYTGTRESVNTFYAQLMMSTGLCEPYALAKEMGIELTNPDGEENPNAPERVPSFVLGVTDTSPLELAEAYATFAGRGLHCDSRPVSSIEDSAGNTLKDYPSSCTQVLAGSVADAVNDVLRGVQEPGGFGYNSGLALPQQSAGKTGTTDSNRSVWFAGYTPNLATVSMIAGANIEGTPITLNYQTVGGVNIGSNASGSGDAGPIWGDAMKVIANYLDDEEFQRPSGSEILGALTLVPSVGGMTIEKASRIIKEAGFEVQVGSQVNSNVDQGLVAWSSPGSGTSFSSGDTVYIYPSSGYVPAPEPKKKKGKNRGNKRGGDDRDD